jgi:hypothetical protein
MNLEIETIMTILIWILATVSLTGNAMLVWYIKKLMVIQEDLNAELVENINVFHGELQKLLETDVLSGEPTLIKLLDDIRELGANTEDIRFRLIPDTEDTNEGEQN